MIGQSPEVPEPAPMPERGTQPAAEAAAARQAPPREIGGRDGPDPTRYGEWEKNGRCVDF